MQQVMEQLPPGYRVWPISRFPYIVIYDLAGGVPCIARLVHTARDLPAALHDLIHSPVP